MDLLVTKTDKNISIKSKSIKSIKRTVQESINGEQINEVDKKTD